MAGLAVGLLGAIGLVLTRVGPLAPVRVTVAPVVSASVQPALFGLGTVEARRSVLVGPIAPARVRRVEVDVGASVRAGQLLAELDPVDLDERGRALDAALARADSAITAAEAQRRDAQARLTLAQASTRRYAELGRQDFVSTGAIEARQQEQASAEAGSQAAAAALTAAQHDRQRLVAERAALQQQRASLRLIAPVDGQVISRDAEPGSTVVAGQAVLRLIDASGLWVRLRLDQGRSAGLAPGLAAQVVRRAEPGQALRGRIERVELLGDSVTEERIALVSLDAPPPGLSIGEIAEVTLALAPTAAAPVVPAASLRRWQGRLGVWRLDADGRPDFVAVRSGATSLDGQAQVLESPLRAGDRVVVHSDGALQAGARLRIVDTLLATAAKP
jgi:HlyD family secretion protein